MLSVSYEGFLEKRLSKRGKQLSCSLSRNFSSSIQRISCTRAEQVAFYRFLNNDVVTEDLLIEEQKQRCAQLSRQKVVLCISDTTEANFFSHYNRLKPNTGLGYTAASINGLGFLAHVCFVIDAKSYLPYGIADTKIWHRENRQSKTEDEVYRLPISQKESKKWIEGCRNADKLLSNAAAIIHIQDREADVYEQLMDLPQDRKTFYIIRSNHNRTTDKQHRLYEQLEQSAPLGTYRLQLNGEGKQ